MNQRFVERYSAGVDPIGRRLRLHHARAPQARAIDLSIVGVAPSIRQRPMSDVLPVIYVPFRRVPEASAAILVRSATDGVAHRTQEVGVRLALGADRRQVVGLFLRAAAWRLAAGVGLGTIPARRAAWVDPMVALRSE